jgi:hypothetical protein
MPPMPTCAPLLAASSMKRPVMGTGFYVTRTYNHNGISSCLERDLYRLKMHPIQQYQNASNQLRLVGMIALAVGGMSPDLSNIPIDSELQTLGL